MNVRTRNRNLRRRTSGKKQALRFVIAPALIVLALSVGLAVSAGIGSARSTVAPKNTQPPEISGKTQVGVTVKSDNGTWTGTTPLTYAYQWRICNDTGGACHDIAGATGNEYNIKADDLGNTLRVQVTAKNADGSDTATSVPSAAITAATTTPPTSTGCPKTTKSVGTIPIAGITPPARLIIDQFQISPSTITFGTQSLTARFHVSACGGSVQGALVFVTAVPYNMFSVPNEQTTGADGWATLEMRTLSGFPATQKQQLLVMFARARKSGDPVLTGISSRRLVSFRVQS